MRYPIRAYQTDQSSSRRPLCVQHMASTRPTEKDQPNQLHLTGQYISVFSFNNPITAVGAVSTTAGSAVSVASGNDVIVTLTAVPDNSRVTVTLTSVNSIPTPFAASMGFLIGDVNTTRSVNSSDISGVKARSGQATTSLNFRFDVNATGAINASDISAVKARSGLTLPP